MNTLKQIVSSAAGYILFPTVLLCLLSGCGKNNESSQLGTTTPEATIGQSTRSEGGSDEQADQKWKSEMIAHWQKPTAVNGSTGYWLRGRLLDPLPQDLVNTLPEVEGIKLSTTVNQALTPTFSLSAPYAPPAATASGATAFSQASPQLARLSAPGVFQSVSQSAPNAANLGGYVNNEAGQPVQGAVVTIANPDDPSFGRGPGQLARSL